MQADIDPDIDKVKNYLLNLQDHICGRLEIQDGLAKFQEDKWERAEGGGGPARRTHPHPTAGPHDRLPP